MLSLISRDSDLGGGIVFFYLMLDGLYSWLQNGTLLDKFLFLVHVVAAQIMMLCSTVFHTLYCVHRAYAYLARLDLSGKDLYIAFFVFLTHCTFFRTVLITSFVILFFSGIGILIVGSYYFPLYYTFYCHTFWFLFYAGCISLLGFICIYQCWCVNNK